MDGGIDREGAGQGWCCKVLPTPQGPVNVLPSAPLSSQASPQWTVGKVVLCLKWFGRQTWKLS